MFNLMMMGHFIDIFRKVHDNGDDDDAVFRMMNVCQQKISHVLIMQIALVVHGCAEESHQHTV